MPNRTLLRRTRPEPLTADRPILLHAIFERTTAGHARRPAVSSPDGSLSYSELNAAAERLADHLVERGIGPGDLVAIYLPRGANLYVALLGILKAGAAYVPIDADTPTDRVSLILADANIRIVVTDASLPVVGRERLFVANLPAIASLPRRVPNPDDACYVIYTSGSTGTPKGVVVEHRQAVHLTETENGLFRIRPEDRVFQGFSPAFDASVEEIWLAFRSGAMLVVGTKEMLAAGPELADRLTAAGVTVLSTVPTLLSLFRNDLPTVRLLILGGEVCPPDLVTRWAKPGRRMVNTYGPTETTVIATAAECIPGKPVTIGQAIPGYQIYLHDEAGRPTPHGAIGEIVIGGLGVARGYLGRDDLTNDRFIVDPHSPFPGGRMYRSGDLGRWNDAGQLEYHGRADRQVKIRGYRVELSEIEAVIRTVPGIAAAAVRVDEPQPGLQRVIGYIVPRAEPVAIETVRSVLRDRLPRYMIPTHWMTLETLPMLPSGKTDVSALPTPADEPQALTDHSALGSVLHAWAKAFGGTTIQPDDDFFADLGGHSLLATRVVSALRDDPRFATLSVGDLYAHPTPTLLAAMARSPHTPGTILQSPHTSKVRYALCGVGQAFGLFVVCGLVAAQWLVPYAIFGAAREAGAGIAESAVMAMASLAAMFPVMLFIGAVGKWTVIGRFRAGSYPLWGFMYLRFWFVRMLLGIVPTQYLQGTPLLNWYYRLLGAKIGKSVYLGTDELFTFDLLTLGDGAHLGADSALLGFRVEQGVLHLGPIDVGTDAFVGTRCVLGIGSRLEAGAMLEDLSLLPVGAVAPAGVRMHGSPARVHPSPAVRQTHRPTAGWRAIVWFMLGTSLFPALLLGAILPGVLLLHAISEAVGLWYLAAAPLVSALFVATLALEIVALKWLLLGRTQPGTYPLYGSIHLRKWSFDQALDLTLDLLRSLYATQYLNPWYRLLGAKIGSNAEISTASFISPDLLSIGADGFIADSASIGAARYEAGTLSIGSVTIAPKAFVGNSALLAPGAFVPSDALVGCLSTLPITTERAEGTSWVGSPAFVIPARPKAEGFSETETYRPTAKLRRERWLIEGVRVVLPGMMLILMTCGLLEAFFRMEETLELWQILLIGPVLYGSFAIAATAFVVVLKWLLMGRYRPSEKPLWSRFVWKSELVTAMREGVADLYLLRLLVGTPFLAPFMRLFGAHIGKQVYLGTTDLTEFDLVHIGDRANVNEDATLQTHLFEDRVMKMSHVRIGDDCTVGAMALVLYDTEMRAGSSIDELSLVMKGETLPEGSASRDSGGERVKSSSPDAPSTQAMYSVGPSPT